MESCLYQYIALWPSFCSQLRDFLFPAWATRYFGVWKTAVSKGPEKKRGRIQTNAGRQLVAGFVSRLETPSELCLLAPHSPAPRRQRATQQRSLEPMVGWDPTGGALAKVLVSSSKKTRLPHSTASTQAWL